MVTSQTAPAPGPRRAAGSAEGQRTEGQFERLLEAAPDAMVGVDAQGTIRFVNRQTEVLFGYARAELLGRPIEVLVPESFRAQHPAHRSDYVASPRPRPMGLGLDLTARRRDGSEFPADISLSSTETDDGLLVTATVRDITDRVRVDQGVARAAAMIECSDDAIIGHSMNSTIASWNPAAERLYGYSPDEILGRSDSLLIPPGHADYFQRIFDRLKRGERVAHYEACKLAKDGRVIDVSVSASPTRDRRGQLLGFTTMSRDITDRKKTEATIHRLNAELEQRVEQRTSELAEAVEELEAFSYSVAHDLRAPLRAIDGFSRILEEEYGTGLDDEGRRLISIVRGATTSMSGLIDDLLNFSRIGRQQVQASEIDMDDLVGAVVAELSLSYRDRDVSVSVGPLPPARGDRALVRQVLLNLVSNAVKFTKPRAHAEIAVSGRVEGTDVVYQVVDNGVGFDKAYEEKLFQVFQRLHPTEFEGTGVGLAIVQRIVHRHGGRVWADSEVGAGATFAFSLPAQEVVR